MSIVRRVSMTQLDWQQEDSRNIEYYSRLAEEFGDDLRSIDWGSRESQHRRFQILSEIGNISGKSVLDVGAGLGDFWGWLKERSNVRYTGIDITPKMVNIARRKFPDVNFQECDILTAPENELGHFDYVFASGIFTYRVQNGQQYLENMIQKLFSSCNLAVGFNCLSTWSEKQHANEFHASPLSTLSMCREITQWVTLRHDYHAGDFTIYMYRKNS